ncbi:MAG TPA: ribonuclease D [Gammaproteobacteria bacterium]|nr:ribonuclease D [Gammaproteobacteria bacterium]
MDTEFALIETEMALNELCERLSGKPWIAIDTEFLREKTYYPKLCLIQLASEDEIACIDPLKITDLAKFSELMVNPEVTKVFHSAAQDMETLQQTIGRLPTPIFDTQIAAALLGQGDQIGYAALVEKLLDIRLPKTQTRTDWSRRPLSSDQLHYAADDVRHLREIYKLQQPLLEQLGRTDWEREESAKLEIPEKYRPQPSLLLRRVKGQHGLSTRERAIIRELALWRETIAEKKNLPRKWILSDNTLVEIAQAELESRDDIGSIKSLTPRAVNQYGKQLFEITSRIRSLDNDAIKQLIPHQTLTAAENNRVKKIQKKLAEIAAETGITQSLIASRKDIEHLVQGDRNIPLMESWRYDIAGKTIERML